ncbi:MAG: twitch domain-containing radical SAM protein [Xanthomonadales bacterium]|nr:twitch domain-containing radical SAM protein [Xanthomonadales bacterium]MCB1611450.1 twitch domain-containing radical SAM protein [Xanthomonadales bacterium]MCP5475602.1 twitch domain-containing radical SAM protein [Rhodanobacteraceae bacterium]
MSENALDDGDAFCVMPFVHLHITHDGAVTPCCAAPTTADLSFGNINQQPIAGIWNGPAMQEFRARMRAGQRDERCIGCHDKEGAGWVSLRNISNRKYAEEARRARTQPDGPAPIPAPIYVDIRFSNFCNLRCRICGPTSSSAWHSDAVALGWTRPGSPARLKCSEDPTELWRQLRVLAPDLKEVYFAGGEPMVMDEHYQFLELLRDVGNTGIKLQYNTNFSLLNFKRWDAPTLWQDFSDITVSASLDGMGARGEYQRSNQRWSDVLANRARLRTEVPHVKFLITPAVSVFNLLHLPEFDRAAIESGLIQRFDLIPSLLVRPVEYNIQILPPALKRLARERIEAHLTWLTLDDGCRDGEQRAFVIQQWKNILRYLDAGSMTQRIPAFLERTAVLDRLRGENFATVFPELASLASADCEP